MATEEDRVWGTGRCSKTMYCGDWPLHWPEGGIQAVRAPEHALQQDMLARPASRKIIAMALDLMHARRSTMESRREW